MVSDAACAPATSSAPLTPHKIAKTAHNTHPSAHQACVDTQEATYSAVCNGFTARTQGEVAWQAALRGQGLSAEQAQHSAKVLTELQTISVPNGNVQCVHDVSAYLSQRHKLEDNFVVYDLGRLARLYKAWKQAFPLVHPYYAVKCNPDTGMIKMLAALGCGFDCASKREMEAVRKLGVPRELVVLANCCKRPCDVRYQKEWGVSMTTFDCETELIKLKEMYPEAQLLIRIRADDPAAQCDLGVKYGCDPHTEARPLLRKAAEIGMNVIGVAFHVGSGCSNVQAFAAAVAESAAIFEMARELGFGMRLLDIGGGFWGRWGADGSVQLSEVSRVVNAAIEEWFPESGAGQGVEVIAEPGRFFAESVMSLSCYVMGARDRVDETQQPYTDYWITDGLYGSMNGMIYDHAPVKAVPVLTTPPTKPPTTPPHHAGGGPPTPLYNSTVFGPTCDGLDVVFKGVMLPRLSIGDWLLFPEFGAYTVAGASDFNGVEASDPERYYVFSGREGGGGGYGGRGGEAGGFGDSQLREGGAGGVVGYSMCLFMVKWCNQGAIRFARQLCLAMGLWF